MVSIILVDLYCCPAIIEDVLHRVATHLQYAVSIALLCGVSHTTISAV